MIELKGKYLREELLKFINDEFLSDFNSDVRQVNTSGLTSIQKANYLGESKNLDLQVFEFFYDGSSNKRVALTKDAFSVMRSSAIFRALAIFKSTDSDDWRFSLLTATPEATEKGKVAVSYSNPKRLSFFLGPNAKVNTPTKFLISKGKVLDFEDLKSRFSIEVVNKEFYKEISYAFTKLVSGMLKLPDSTDKSQTNLEFAVRLIGRIIFCWFLKEKKNKDDVALVPQELLSLNAISKNEDYYHNVLEPIFFEILNKPIKERIEKFTSEPYSTIPYLNGGLFSPEKDDFYKRGIYQSDFYNNLVIPDEWLKGFFAILETYNFTIDENTSYDEELSIDPEMLGRIFENLLAEINPETGESARKSTGSYYTPRIIVDYMVDESLLLYLKQQTGIKEEKLKAVISYELSDDIDNQLTLEEREKIVNALEKVKILDPACGSGAFPIGALQKIVFILQQVDQDGSLWFKKQLAKASPEFRKDIEKKFSNKEFDFLRKLGVIRECIYGVDIQPIATEISRLRCFLTLIVDEHIDDDEENRGIKPLPNLDFKFVTANSLIGLPKIESSEVQQQSLLPDNKEDIDELKKIRDDYFTSFGVERVQLKADFADQQKLLTKQLFQNYKHAGATKNDLMQKLTDWEPFTHKQTDWFDPEWMFGIKEGFDIVIANPPYIRQEKLGVIYKELLKKEYPIIANGTADIYVYFFGLGLKLIKNKSVLIFISLNKYLKTKYGIGLRNLISEKYSIITIIDFFELPVFEASTDTAITVILNEDSDIETKYYPIKTIDSLNLSNLKSTPHLKVIKDLAEWKFIDQTQIGILSKIYKDSISLKSFTNDKIFSGVKTAFNKAFVLTTQAAQNLLNTESKDIVKKYANSTDIERWNLFNKNRFILATGYDVNIKDDYPAAFDYLSQFETQLRDRLDKGKYWWNLRACKYYLEFEKPKIIYMHTAKNHQFYFDQEGRYINNSCYMIISDNKYLLSFLNSNLFRWFKKIKFVAYGDAAGKGRVKLDYNKMTTVPIKNISVNEQRPFQKIVNKILTITKFDDFLENHVKQEEIKEYEKQINQMIYKLYGLTEDEIKIVEENNES